MLREKHNKLKGLDTMNVVTQTDNLEVVVTLTTVEIDLKITTQVDMAVHAVMIVEVSDDEMWISYSLLINNAINL